MPNFATAMSQEIERVANKTFKKMATEMEKTNKELRKEVSDLKKEVARLSKGAAAPVRAAGRKVAAKASKAAKAVKEGPSLRVTSKTVKTLRDKLKLTQTEFAKLLGVSLQAVGQWEKKGGRLNLRSRPMEAIAAAKSMGARQARAALEAGKTAVEAVTGGDGAEESATDAMEAAPAAGKTTKRGRKKTAKKTAKKTTKKKTAKRTTKKAAKKTAKKITKKAGKKTAKKTTKKKRGPGRPRKNG